MKIIPGSRKVRKHKVRLIEVEDVVDARKKADIKRFIDIVKPFIPKGMEYKIREVV